MALQLPILGTAAGGTQEIVVNGSTGLLHPMGKQGVIPLARNMVKLSTHNGKERLREGETEVFRTPYGAKNCSSSKGCAYERKGKPKSIVNYC
ncbi:hypothetical protein ACH5RR_028456 [Cinchona calisaya]|uniref:Uncharacterized protein n=1 Tax=Cinchona calisaya TaxID=153742 RepID=A0ABD2YSH0_9GENT